MTATSIALNIFEGRASDRNDRAMKGAVMMGNALAAKMSLEPSRTGTPQAPLSANWAIELEAARPELGELRDLIFSELEQGLHPVTCLGRCAAGLGTLPAVARVHPDAAIVWIDAHGDSNSPADTTTNYLGGMILTGAAGIWETGLGAGVNLSNVILVGCRDLDPVEKSLIDQGTIKLLHVSSDFPARLRSALAGRDVYVHLDCDVLNPGLVPSEFQVENGLSLEDLAAVCRAIADHHILGLEISEFEATWPDGTRGDPILVITAIESLLTKMQQQ
jgi:arginase